MAVTIRITIGPCRLCPHAVCVVELECFNDLWGYAVEPLTPDSYKVILKKKTSSFIFRFKQLDMAVTILI